MDMKLPDSGSWLGTLFSDGTTVHSDAFVVHDVSEPQLVEALDSMARGDVEFVILEDGDAFIQAAGQGDGAYELNYKAAGDESLYEVSGGVRADVARNALLSYRRGDGRWHIGQPWSPL